MNSGFDSDLIWSGAKSADPNGGNNLLVTAIEPEEGAGDYLVLGAAEDEC